MMFYGGLYAAKKAWEHGRGMTCVLLSAYLAGHALVEPP